MADQKLLGRPGKVKLKYWIKERHNTQLGVYYVACGQMSEAEAMRREKALYGSNFMHSFEYEVDYQARLSQLRDAGERVLD